MCPRPGLTLTTWAKAMTEEWTETSFLEKKLMKFVLQRGTFGAGSTTFTDLVFSMKEAIDYKHHPPQSYACVKHTASLRVPAAASLWLGGTAWTQERSDLLFPHHLTFGKSLHFPVS